jgi:uncharacterized protein (DUF58 family)
MGRLVLLGGLIFGLIFVGLLTLQGDLIALVIPLVIYLAAALWYGPREVNLQATRSLNAVSVVPDKPVQIMVSVTNQGKQQETLLVEDLVPAGLRVIDGKTRALVTLPPGGVVDLHYTVQGKRGAYLFQDIDVLASEQLGLYRRKIRLVAPRYLLILPDVWRLRTVAIRPLRTRIFSGPVPARQGGTGVSFFSVRNYQTGDPLRRVNWKATARHDQDFYSNDFEQERVADVGLILDSRQQSDLQVQLPGVQKGSEKYYSLFEYAVCATAALADVFLRDGNRVGLLIYGRGREMTFPGYGKQQRVRILQALAHAKTGDNMALESLGYLPTRFFPARSQIVLISPLIRNDLPVLARLRALGYQLLLISPDPITFRVSNRRIKDAKSLELAKRIARIERVIMLRSLQRTGIQVVDWQIDRSFDWVLQASLGRRPREFRVVGEEA